MDFFTVSTVTGRVLFVLVLVSHRRRHIVHFNIAEHPTAQWAAQQVVEAFPDDTAPRWLLRDRDSIYGDAFRRRVAGMAIAEIVCSPASPWQNPYAERVIGSIRRECLDDVIVFGEAHLRRLLSAHVAYYHRSRTHLGLGKDTPDGRPIQPTSAGKVIVVPESVVFITDTSVARRKRHVPSLCLGSIRFGGHFPKGGYDVHDGRYQTPHASAPALQ
jgi:putative transposase